MCPRATLSERRLRDNKCPWSVLRTKAVQVVDNLFRKRCRKCFRVTCKCWLYFRSDVADGMFMESVREPVVIPSSGIKSPTSGGVFPRSTKPVTLVSPTGAGFPVSCYRRATSVHRGGYRTAGVYRNRSGSVPPPSEAFGVARERPPASLFLHQLPPGALRRAIGVGSNGGTARKSPGDPSHRDIVWAQLDLLQMDCSIEESGGGLQGPQNECESPSEVTAITTEERLLKTNPIWFLADLQRKGAVHLLQGKEDGSFLVRQSSQTNTLAISVRLPPDKGPHVQHYLVEIQPQGLYSLEASDNRFETLPALLAYYTNYCDELPVKLKLPKCVQEAKSRHELASIALLGQEFWGTPLASPSSPASMVSITSPSSLTSPLARPNDLVFSSFGKGSMTTQGCGNSTYQLTSPGVGDQITPSRPAPPPPIPLPGDRSSLNLNLTSLDDALKESPVSLSSFRSNSNTPQTPHCKPVPPPRISPPSVHGRVKGPLPPPRKLSSSDDPAVSPSSNITVTTTLTFCVNQGKPVLPHSLNSGEDTSPSPGSTQLSSPSSQDEKIQLHVSSLEISPANREGLRLHFRPASFSSPSSQPATPQSDSGGVVAPRKLRSKRKNSKNSENLYYRSSLADKISDYEDLWTSPQSPIAENRNGDYDDIPFFGERPPSSFSSFKPRQDISKSLGDLSDVRKKSQESDSELNKPSSPFYVEPLDAVRRAETKKPRNRRPPRKSSSNRHSDSNIEWRKRSVPMNGKMGTDTLSSREDINEDGSPNLNNNRGSNKGLDNSQIDFTTQPKKTKETRNWVDASFEFLTYVGSTNGDALTPGSMTAQALIERRLPHLVVQGCKETPINLRHSAYDNVSRRSSFSDSGTEFSEPWDSRKWDSLLSDSRNGTDSPESLVQVTGDSESFDSEDESPESHFMTLSLSQKTNNFDTQLRSKILSPQMLALRHRKDAESGAAVRRFAMALGNDPSTTFSKAIRHFLTCTLEGSEREASVVVRNVRQFMSGMKNYLVTSGEGEFEAIVTRERSNLKPNEFLNLDAILEDVLVRLVLRPIWTHINQLFVDALSSNGSIQRLADNLAYARGVPESKLGIRSCLYPPKGAALEAIQLLLKKMQHVYAPREKLGHLLGIISHIYHTMYENGDCVPANGDADDLVPILMWVIAHENFISAEVEADYLQGLLLPSSAGGEASFYLSAFHSAIHSLKNIDTLTNANETQNVNGKDLPIASAHSVLRVLVPDEKNGSIVTRTLPLRPGCTVKELCRMMAHKLRVTNPQDFALYKLIDGNEIALGDNECPQRIKEELSARGSHCLIAFKRIDAKIAWPIIN